MAHCNHGCRWSRLNLVDLAPTVVDEIVIPLHYALEFLHVFAVLATPLHHALELGHGRHLHLATSVQYRSAQTSVMTRIFGMPKMRVMTDVCADRYWTLVARWRWRPWPSSSA